MTPFKIAFDQTELDWIRGRVADYRWHEQPADAEWQYGANLSYMREFQRYWLEEYDWRTVERELNRHPHFTAEVDGLRLHFIHKKAVTPTGRPPLLLVHGWPGSFFEFDALVGPLTDPAAHGGDPRDAFDVVIPSLPGYVFSQAPSRPIGPQRVAELFDRLMTETLGYPAYYVQGGDWGGAVGARIGFNHADHCRALHLNIMGAAPGGPSPGLMGSSVATPETAEELAWAGRMGEIVQREFGYSMVHSTKSQSLGYAMMDSPIGIAAWIIEKFQGWSDLRGRTLDEAFDKKTLLTNIMLYLGTRCFNTAMWMYRGVVEEGLTLPEGRRVEVPVGFAVVPCDIILTPPRTYVEKGYNVVRWSEFPRGGHFTALEVPDLFLADVRAFFRELEGG